MCQSKQLTDLSRLFLSPVTSQLLIEGVFTPGPIDFILEVKTQVIDTPWEKQEMWQRWVFNILAE